MELKYTSKHIKFEKELNSLDEFTLDFTSVLNELNIKYVIISGYVSILFGRNRASEDIDMFIEELDKEKFEELWDKLQKEYECNINDIDEVYEEYLKNETAVRFSIKNTIIPNMEMKFATKPIHKWVLENRRKVILNEKNLFISPLEFQIAIKLEMGSSTLDTGSNKDIEDAKYLYDVFKEKLNLNDLNELIERFKVKEIFNLYIK